MKCSILGMQISLTGLQKATLHIEIPATCVERLPRANRPLTVEIKAERKLRSLNANSYCWKLCDEMAAMLHSTKLEIYRLAIRQAGVWQDMDMVYAAYPRFDREWRQKGTSPETGYFTDILTPPEGGRCTVRAYYGTHTYSTAEMSKLIDWLVTEAEGMGIETMTPAEVESLLEEWQCA